MSVLCAMTHSRVSFAVSNVGRRGVERSTLRSPAHLHTPTPAMAEKDLSRLESALDGGAGAAELFSSKRSNALPGWSPSAHPLPVPRVASRGMEEISLDAPPPAKSKAELKRERRDKQEADRARKQTNNQPIHDKKRTAKNRTAVPASKQVALFDHLPQVERSTARVESATLTIEGVHPAIVALGLKYANGVVDGADARALTLLRALKEVVEDYVCPRNGVLCRDLDAHLRPGIAHLESCRTKSLSMGNAIRHIRSVISKIPSHMSEASSKRVVTDAIDDFERVHVIAAGDAVVANAAARVAQNDVILVYGDSGTIDAFLARAGNARNKNSFRVIVVGRRPVLRARVDPAVRTLQALCDAKVDCSFVQLSGISYVMRDVTKVFLGAHAMYSNGTVLSDAGTALVACVASEFRVPVIALCSTYRFSERVQLDAIVYNELKDPDSLILPDDADGDALTADPIADWRDIPTLRVLNLEFDLTPADLISAVVTEVGVLPPSSVPVIVRERAEALANFTVRESV